MILMMDISSPLLLSILQALPPQFASHVRVGYYKTSPFQSMLADHSYPLWDCRSLLYQPRDRALGVEFEDWAHGCETIRRSGNDLLCERDRDIFMVMTNSLYMQTEWFSRRETMLRKALPTLEIQELIVAENGSAHVSLENRHLIALAGELNISCRYFTRQSTPQPDFRRKGSVCTFPEAILDIAKLALFKKRIERQSAHGKKRLWVYTRPEYAWLLKKRFPRIEALCDELSVDIYLKIHPHESIEAYRWIAQRPSVTAVHGTDLSALECFLFTDICMTPYSSVGIDACAWEIPTLFLGDGKKPPIFVEPGPGRFICDNEQAIVETLPVAAQAFSHFDGESVDCRLNELIDQYRSKIVESVNGF